MDKWSYYRLCEIFCWPFGPEPRRQFRQISGTKNESFCLIYKNFLLFLCVAFMLFNSTKNVVFVEILVDQILKFLVPPVSAKIKSFERFFKQCIFLLEDYLWQKFQYDRTIFGGQRSQNPLKMSHFMDTESVWKTFNLINTNAILMKFTTIIYCRKVFNFQ